MNLPRKELLSNCNDPQGIKKLIEQAETVLKTWQPEWSDFVDAPQPVRMFIRGGHYRGSARTILDDPELKADVFSRLRPTVPAWLPDALNGKLVVVTLEE